MTRSPGIDGLLSWSLFVEGIQTVMNSFLLDFSISKVLRFFFENVAL